MKMLRNNILLLLLVLLCQIDGVSQVPSVINVEIDWMEGGFPFHSHKPNQDEIDAVVRMFACQGITLNVVLSNNVGHVTVLKRNPLFCGISLFDYYGEDSFGEIKDNNFGRTGGGWHYALFAHQYEDDECSASGSSGLANDSEDLVVTLGSFSGQIGTPWDRAATFAHELGHNLGLSHVGDLDEESTGPYLITLPSIMSYAFQLAGVRTQLECMKVVPPGSTLFKDLDYSHGTACTLYEPAMDERIGMGITPVDWNCNSVIDSLPVNQDLSNSRNTSGNFWCGLNGPRTFLRDYDEWANIRDVTFSSKTSRSEPERVFSCITAEEVQTLAEAAGGCPQPTISNEACISNRMLYVRKGASGIQFGTCRNPFSTINFANLVSSDGDYIFVSPGNYNEALTISKRLLISGPGVIVIGE